MSIHHVAIEDQATGNLVPTEMDDALPADALFDIEDAWEGSRKAMMQALRRARVSRHRVGMLGFTASREPGRLILAKFIELARRERNQSPQELAARAGVDLSDVVALENPEWQTPGAQVIESVAAALDVDALPLLELSGFRRSENKAFGELAVEFAARLEAMKPLEPQELEALIWLRNHAFKSRPKHAEVG